MVVQEHLGQVVHQEFLEHQVLVVIVEQVVHQEFLEHQVLVEQLASLELVEVEEKGQMEFVHYQHGIITHIHRQIQLLVQVL